MPPILTGGRPLSGSGDINAPACTIVKWQPVHASIHNDPMTRAALHAGNAAHVQFRIAHRAAPHRSYGAPPTRFTFLQCEKNLPTPVARQPMAAPKKS